MYLSRLIIKNYRSIKNMDIPLSKGKNVIVGRNNAGKSNIIKAVDLVLGESSPTYQKSENISDKDFYNGNSNEDIVIMLQITREERYGELEVIDFSSYQKSAFFEIQKSGSPVTVEFTDLETKQVGEIKKIISEDFQASIDDKSSGFTKRWIGGKPYCKTNLKEYFNDKKCFAFIFLCNKEEKTFNKNIAFFACSGDKWILLQNAGFLRECLMQSAVIPSFRDPKEQLRISSWSWFGRLLRKYIRTDDEKLLKSYQEVKKTSDALFKEMKDQICGNKFNVAFPNTSISFQFNPDLKADIYKNTLIYVDDGFNSELQDKGAGIQSAVTIALYDYYIRNIAHSSGHSLLAIEEPELYLHPHGRRVISDRLTDFIDGGNNQVIITSHSAEFISNIHEDVSLIVVKKADGESKATTLQIKEPKEKQILIKKQNAEMFFSDFVILSEGADKYIIEEIAAQYGSKQPSLGNNWLNKYNISILNCGGKTEFWKYADILKRLNIPHFIIADFDFIRDGLNDFFTKLDFEKKYCTQINELKGSIANSSKWKTIEDIPIAKKDNFKKYIKGLEKDSIFIISGELENFYKIKPKYDKEAGVVETISRMIEENKSISEYINTEEYDHMIQEFINRYLNISGKQYLSP